MKLFIAAAFAIAACAADVSISNTECRHDVDGNIMDTHDGNIVQWEEGGLYWYYSMGYQDCKLEHSLMPPQECPGIYHRFGGCGFREDHALRIYTSPNLKDWTLVSLDGLEPETRPYGIYFRPKVVYNAKNKQYVLWINHLPRALSPLRAYHDTGYAVATASTPQGPFKFILEQANLGESAPGDADIFVDENGVDAYIAYNGWNNKHTLLVEKLNEDWTDSLGSTWNSGPITSHKQEAPAMFQRNGYYYLLHGHTCCFCRHGSDAWVKVATDPLGPWKDMDLNLNPERKGIFTSDHVVKGQNSMVIRYKNQSKETGYIFVSDLWSSADDGLKSHDKQFWQELEFDDSVTPPAIKPFEWRDSCDLKDMPDVYSLEELQLSTN